jgi:monolysocardiolipin acyltransferase
MLTWISRAVGGFFNLGQVLPTRRQGYSPHGGIFQPTLVQAIRLLSSQPFNSPSVSSDSSSSLTSSSSNEVFDPFTTGGLTYSTNGTDRYTAPSVYNTNRHAWVHVFPEGCIHQHPDLSVRYFKWGISRLILESEPAPDVLPMFIDGTQHIMAQDRKWPRFLPRTGKHFKMAIGELMDVDEAFGDLRAKWRDLVKRDQQQRRGRPLVLGELTEELKYGEEAVALRVEVAKRVRDEMERLRVRLGYPEDDPALGLAETWAKEPNKRDFKSNVDGSLVKKE